MGEEQTNFKVTDRRLFNADGSPRDVPPEERAPEPVAAATAAPDAAPATQTATAAATEPAPQPTASESTVEEPEAGRDEFPGAEDPSSFANFIMSIASNAASSLGMMEHPVTGKREVDLELGKHWIDVLSMLKQKTQNNLLPPEQQILESLLADLQMQYVSLTHAAAKTPRTFTGRDITGG